MAHEIMGHVIHSSFLVLLLLSHASGALKSRIQLTAEIDSCDQQPPGGTQGVVEDCQHKLLISLKLINGGMTPNDTKYLKIDKAHDKRLHQDVRLYNTVVLQLQQEQVSLVYPFHQIGLVNNKAYETFVTKDNTNDYPGCNGDTLPHLCGFAGSEAVHHHKKVEKAFCCPCLKDAQSPKRYHLRGGQDCTNRTIKGDKKDTYHSSAHCLKFDPIWYSVNHLGHPTVEHEVHMNAYIAETDKHQHIWLDVTEGREINLGTHNDEVFNTAANGKIVAFYTQLSDNDDIDHRVFNHSKKRLLIPRLNQVLMQKIKPLQITEGPSRYLIVDETQIDMNGRTCNKAGVSFQAFVNQPDRCSVPNQSCLDNQPMHFWLHDVENDMSNRRGKYFLSNYFKMGPTPILINKETKVHSLSVMYMEPHVSEIYMEMNADGLLPLHEGVTGQITEAYFGSGSHSHNQITLTIFNRGWISAIYYTRLVKCINATAAENKVNSRMIEPHQSLQYVMNVETSVNGTGPAACIAELLNGEGNVVAAREVVFDHSERCVCEGYCRCECLEFPESLVCRPMSQEEYHVAGFRGSVPKLMSQSAHVGWQAALAVVILLFMLCMLGILKGLLGTVLPCIGRLGLNLFTRGKRLPRYYEKELWGMSVVYEKGVPVHPVCGTPVMVMSPLKEFGLNFIFFFYFPFMGFHYLWVIWHEKRRSQDRVDYTVKDTFHPGLPALDEDSDDEPIFENVFVPPYLKTEKKGTGGNKGNSKQKTGDQDGFFSADSDGDPSSGGSKTKGKNKTSKASVKSSSDKSDSDKQGMDEFERYPGSARKWSLPLSKRNLRESVRQKLSSLVSNKLSSSESEGSNGKAAKTVEKKETKAKAASSSKTTQIKDTKTEPKTKDAPDENKAYAEVLKLAESGKRIYYNFTRPDDRLIKSGSTFSLCGCLKKAGDAFEFNLDIHNMQVYENLGGERQELEAPHELSHVNFCKLMTATDVLQVITLYPLYPCLNKVLLHQSDSGASLADSTHSMFFNDH